MSLNGLCPKLVWRPAGWVIGKTPWLPCFQWVYQLMLPRNFWHWTMSLHLLVNYSCFFPLLIATFNFLSVYFKAIENIFIYLFMIWGWAQLPKPLAGKEISRGSYCCYFPCSKTTRTPRSSTSIFQTLLFAFLKCHRYLDAGQKMPGKEPSAMVNWSTQISWALMHSVLIQDIFLFFEYAYKIGIFLGAVSFKLSVSHGLLSKVWIWSW